MDKTPKVWLTDVETENILSVAKKHRYSDYLILMLCRYGLRDGEILGVRKLPGIHVGDLRDNGIWLVGKGYSHEGEAPSLYPLPLGFAKELSAYSVKEGRGKQAKLFDLSVRQLERVVKSYAKEANVADWQHVVPHRLRAFFRDGPEQQGIVGVPDSRHDETQQRDDDKPLRRQDPNGVSNGDNGKPKRFWVLGVLAALLFYHSYGILSGIYSDLNIVTYDQALALGVIEALIFPVLTAVFLWKSVVWWHERPYTQKHVFDDQNILD